MPELLLYLRAFCEIRPSCPIFFIQILHLSMSSRQIFKSRVLVRADMYLASSCTSPFSPRVALGQLGGACGTLCKCMCVLVCVCVWAHLGSGTSYQQGPAGVLAVRL